MQGRLNLSGYESFSFDELKLHLKECQYAINYLVGAKRSTRVLDDLYQKRRSIQLEISFRLGLKETT